jgi:hypothetical protein
MSRRRRRLPGRNAYDEDVARFGPEVEVPVGLDGDSDSETDVCWLDTCTAPNNQHTFAPFPGRRCLAMVMSRAHASHDATVRVSRQPTEAVLVPERGKRARGADR